MQKLVFYLMLVGCILIMERSLLGIGGAAVLTQDYGRGSVESRYTLRMGHSNTLQCMMWALTALWVSVLQKDEVVLLFVGAFGTCGIFLAGSRTAMLVTAYTVFKCLNENVIARENTE